MNFDTLIELRVQYCDMGNTLPLRRVVRPLKGKAVHPLLWATMFIVIPLSWWLDVGLQEFSTAEDRLGLLIMLLIGSFFLISFVRHLTDKVEFEITASEVKLMVRQYFRSRTNTEPLNNYIGLRVLVLDVKRFRFGKTKALHQIYLVHSDESEKDVLLFSKEEDHIWRERLQTYQGLLGKPVLDPQ